MAGILGKWLDGIVEQHKQLANAGKAAEYTVKADPSILDEIGTSQEDFDNWGAREKALSVQGVIQGRGAKQAAQAAQAQAAERLSIANKNQTDADAASGFPDFAQYLNEAMSQGGTPGAAPSSMPPGVADWSSYLNGGGPRAIVQSPGTGTGTGTGAQPAGLPMGQAVLQAIARVRSMNPRVASAIASKVMPQLLQNMNGDEGAVNFTQDPVTGKRFATRGKTMMESGVDPTMAAKAMSGGAVPMMGEDGGVIGYNIPTGSGKFTYSPTKDLTGQQKQNLILQHQKEKRNLIQQLTLAGGNTNILSAINDEIGMHDSAIADLKSGAKGNAAASPAPAAAGPKKVTTQAQYDALASGTVYLGKDGKQYRKP